MIASETLDILSMRIWEGRQRGKSVIQNHERVDSMFAVKAFSFFGRCIEQSMDMQ